MTDFVHATGSAAVTLPNATYVKVPVAARYGNAAYIVGGRFVCPTTGIWRFDVKGGGDGAQFRLRLVDDASAEIDFTGYSGSFSPNNAILSSYTIIDRAIGDKVWLSVYQASGAQQVIDAQRSAAMMMLTATYLGAA